jgi:transglutaminase-like putative cysteine protease
VSAVVVALLAGVAGLAFDGVFPPAALVPVVALAAGVPCVLSLLLSGRLPLWGSLPVSALAWLVAVSATLFRSEAWLGFVPAPAAVRAALLGVRDAGGWLLTTILPAAPGSKAIVLVSFLVWVAATAGGELALRSRSVLLPAVAALPVLAVAVVLGVGGAASVVPYAAVFAGVALLLALVRSARSLGTVLAGVPLLAGLVLAAVVVAPVLPMAERPYDVRQLVEQPPPKPIDGVSALDQVSAWLQNPQRELFTVGTTSEANLRLAVLDTFDGVTWTSNAGFVPTGGRVPGAEGTREGGVQRFTLQKLTGPWLPAADRPVRATGPGMVVDPATGMLASARAAEGLTYEVTSGIRRYSGAELREAVPAADPAALRLPDGPDGRPPPQRARLGEIARKATAGARSPTQQAARLAAYLRKHAVNDVNSAPGHGYRSIEFFLTESRRGTTEQFAASFALLARAIGLPSRIVVGFRPGAAPESAGGARQVRAGDVLAWAEVEFEGIGWVPFYPTPSRTRSGGGGDVAEGEPKQAREIEQAINSDTAQPKPTPTSSRPATPRPEPRTGSSAGPLTWALAAAGALVAYLLAVLIVPPLRRARRRRAGTPAARVGGAWRQTVGRLRGAGIAVSSGALTAREVAYVAESVLGGAAREPLTVLADLANLATFGGEPPVDQADAELAWRSFAAVDVLVRRRVGAGARLVRRLSPAALLR